MTSNDNYSRSYKLMEFLEKFKSGNNPIQSLMETSYDLNNDVDYQRFLDEQDKEYLDTMMKRHDEMK